MYGTVVAIRSGTKSVSDFGLTSAINMAFRLNKACAARGGVLPVRHCETGTTMPESEPRRWRGRVTGARLGRKTL